MSENGKEGNSNKFLMVISLPSDSSPLASAALPAVAAQAEAQETSFSILSE